MVGVDARVDNRDVDRALGLPDVPCEVRLNALRTVLLAVLGVVRVAKAKAR
jgi:hypothetical protein